ncbi:antA/AntB antirepressor family protein [Geoalkalibacter subterraneus]|uniref:antA/AntB antirepressor family protein n=1 Tax=Geoalkalibacter subterraneus TaxID=483547 RepID=UPI0009FDEEE9
MYQGYVKDCSPFLGAVENQDFVVVAQTGKNSKGGRPSIEYRLTIDMAKENCQWPSATARSRQCLSGRRHSRFIARLRGDRRLLFFSMRGLSRRIPKNCAGMHKKAGRRQGFLPLLR